MSSTATAGASPPSHPTLPLTPDALLSTTRSVRRRLDLERPVSRRAARGVPRARPPGAHGVEHPELALGGGHRRDPPPSRSPTSTGAVGRSTRRCRSRPGTFRPRRPSGLRSRRGSWRRRTTSPTTSTRRRPSSSPASRRASTTRPRCCSAPSTARSCRRPGASNWPPGRAAWARAGPRCTCSSSARWPRSSASPTPTSSRSP